MVRVLLRAGHLGHFRGTTGDVSVSCVMRTVFNSPSVSQLLCDRSTQCVVEAQTKLLCRFSAVALSARAFPREKQVHVSDECRERVLNSDVIKIDIFEEARVEMLKAIQVGTAPY